MAGGVGRELGGGYLHAACRWRQGGGGETLAGVNERFHETDLRRVGDGAL